MSLSLFSDGRSVGLQWAQISERIEKRIGAADLCDFALRRIAKAIVGVCSDQPITVVGERGIDMVVAGNQCVVDVESRRVGIHAAARTDVIAIAVCEVKGNRRVVHVGYAVLQIDNNPASIVARAVLGNGGIDEKRIADQK